MSKNAESVKAYRERMKAEGYRPITVMLSPDAATKLDELKRETGLSVQLIVNGALLRCGSEAKAISDSIPVVPSDVEERLASLEHTVGSILEQLALTEIESPTQPPEEQLVRISGTVTKPAQSNEMVEKILQLAGEMWLENDELSLGDILKKLHAKGITYYAKSQSLGKAVRKEGGKEAVIEKAKLRREQASLLG